MTDRETLTRRFEQEPDQATALALAALAARVDDGPEWRRWAVEAAAIGPVDPPVRTALRESGVGFLIRRHSEPRLAPEPISEAAAEALDEPEALELSLQNGAVELIAVHEGGARSLGVMTDWNFRNGPARSTGDGGLRLSSNRPSRPQALVQLWYPGTSAEPMEAQRLPEGATAMDWLDHEGGRIVGGRRDTESDGSVPWLARRRGEDWQDFEVPEELLRNGKAFDALVLGDDGILFAFDNFLIPLYLCVYQLEEPTPRLLETVELPTHTTYEHIVAVAGHPDWLLSYSSGVNHGMSTQTLALLDRASLEERAAAWTHGGGFAFGADADRPAGPELCGFDLRGETVALALGAGGAATLDLDQLQSAEPNVPAYAGSEWTAARPAKLGIDLGESAPHPAVTPASLPLRSGEEVQAVALFGDPTAPGLAALAVTGGRARVLIARP